MVVGRSTLTDRKPRTMKTIFPSPKGMSIQCRLAFLACCKIIRTVCSILCYSIRRNRQRMMRYLCRHGGVQTASSPRFESFVIYMLWLHLSCVAPCAMLCILSIWQVEKTPAVCGQAGLWDGAQATQSHPGQPSPEILTTSFLQHQ